MEEINDDTMEDINDVCYLANTRPIHIIQHRGIWSLSDVGTSNEGTMCGSWCVHTCLEFEETLLIAITLLTLHCN